MVIVSDVESIIVGVSVTAIPDCSVSTSSE